MNMPSQSLSLAQRQMNEQALIAGKRRRRIRDALTGYLFILPALIATLLFGLWPVVSGFYESLKSGSPITNRFVGLDNYVRSLGSLTYVLLFAVALLFLFMGSRMWRNAWADQARRGISLWPYVIPGLLGGLALIVMLLDLVTGVSGFGAAPTV